MHRGWRISILLLPFAVSGCDWIGRQADALGEHMPVIDYRCEHWQCLTASGRAKSEAIKAQNGEASQPVSPSDDSLPDTRLKTVSPAISEHNSITAPQ